MVLLNTIKSYLIIHTIPPVSTSKKPWQLPGLLSIRCVAHTPVSSQAMPLPISLSIQTNRPSHLISPRIPPRHGRSRKQLHPWHIPHQLNNPIPEYLWFLRVSPRPCLNHSPYTPTHPLRFPLHCNQTILTPLPCPKTHPKPGPPMLRLLHPRKARHCLQPKPPRLYHIQCLLWLAADSPHE